MGLHGPLPFFLVAVSLLRFGKSFDLSPPAKSFSKCQGCIRFPGNASTKSVSDVRRILIDKNHTKIIIGARDAIYRLDLSLSLAKEGDVANLSPAIQKPCPPDNSEACHNFIRLLLFDSRGDIFACGTNAMKRGCWAFNRTGDLHPSPYSGDTSFFTPSTKNKNVTGVFAGNFLFTGLNIGEGLQMPSFSHSTIHGQSDVVRTLDDMILDGANFVSSFQGPDSFIYVFLREIAEEDQEKAIYSRVARVCLYDTGVPTILPNKFSSFTKIRLSCKIPGNVPFNYDELQATYLSVNSTDADGFVYGIFSTPELGVLGSAVCVYSFKEIQALFKSSDYLEEESSVWKQVAPPSPDAGKPECNSQLKTKAYGIDTATFAKEHALLSGVVPPKSDKPLFVKHNVRFTQLVADTVAASGQSAPVHVLFIGTDNGTVYKVLGDVSTSGSPFVVEQIQVFEKAEPIYSMEFYKGFIYIGGLSRVVRMPVQRCSQYKSCRTCVSSRDPYCGWSNRKCVTKAAAGKSAWQQDVSSGKFEDICPPEPATCSISVAKLRPGGTSVLLCQAEGIPVPSITSWKKDSTPILESSRVSKQPGPSPGSELLLISKFGVDDLGLYQCTVSAGRSSPHTCSWSYTGGLPEIQFAGLVKRNHTTYFSCKAIGIPKPRVVISEITGNDKKLINANNTPLAEIKGRLSYHCVAQNAFGPVVSKTLSLQERLIEVELKLTEEAWDSDLEDKSSGSYAYLAADVKAAVRKTYSTNPAFLGVDTISFRKGSVIAEMWLRFAAKKSDTQKVLLQDLQSAVSSGRVQGLAVDEDHIVNVAPEEPGLDSGLFAAGIITAIVFSIIIGFLLGVKFHSQATGFCRVDTPSADAVDAGSSPGKNVLGVRFMRSPSRSDADPQGRQSQRKLVKVTSNGLEANVEEDSDESGGGRISPEGRTTSTAITVPERRAPLANGEVVNV